MKKNGDPVTLITGLEDYAEGLVNVDSSDPWKESIESLSGNSLVIPMDRKTKEFGLSLGRVLGLNLKNGYFQHSINEYFINIHNHDTPEKPIYVLFYLWNKGHPGHLNLFDKDALIERKTGAVVVIPPNRLHSVDPIDGENKFIRYVYTRERFYDSHYNKSLAREIRKKNELYYVVKKGLTALFEEKHYKLNFKSS